ncbi:MAG: VIT1/CCC1 transporter family protein [bacterium]|nr:VIT1/CCC1 transporter family protein [bacterium]
MATKNTLSHPETHKSSTALRDVILGGQDGLVNVLGVVLGVSAATSDKRILIAAGLAAAFAESISMAAVAYTSFISERDHYLKERQREEEEIKTVPDVEKQEIRYIYATKGFEGELLEKIVEKITSNDRIWVDTMMQEELHLEPVETKDVLKTSVIVGIAAIIGSIIPLFPYFFLDGSPAFYASLIVSAIALFSVGAYQAKIFIGDWRRLGIQMVVIGIGAALIAYQIAGLFGTNP